MPPNSRPSDVWDINVVCQLNQQRCSLVTFFSPFPGAKAPQCAQFCSIVSDLHLNVIFFDMWAPQAEWCVPSYTYLICYPLGSGPAVAALSSHLPAGTPPPGLLHKQHDSSPNPPPPLRFRVALVPFFPPNLGASKWSELTHYFPPGRTAQKQTSQGHMRMAKHIRHAHIWPCFSSTAHMAVILALWVIIWVISRGHKWVFSMIRALFIAAGSLGGLSLLIQPFFEAVKCCKDNPDYRSNAVHYS